MTRHGIKLAAFIADSIFSTDGILPDPAGFLWPVIEAVHEAGGLYIADEVQPGFARTGDDMWGFQRHGIVPGLVVMGKPMGNGMPIAGVAVRPEIVEEFGQQVRYFNTFGGNSVCVAAAAAVLDVIEAEGLRDHARAVGRYLLDALTAVASSTPRIAAVRGAGLYAGVDFIRPRHHPTRRRRRHPRRQRPARAPRPHQRHRPARQHPQNPPAPPVRPRTRRPASRRPVLRPSAWAYTP
jgi:4-aminobutyrate aminotransferase-like enzyme